MIIALSLFFPLHLALAGTLPQGTVNIPELVEKVVFVVEREGRILTKKSSITVTLGAEPTDKEIPNGIL